MFLVLDGFANAFEDGGGRNQTADSPPPSAAHVGRVLGLRATPGGRDITSCPN